MSFNPEQFRELVVRPTLEYLDPEIPYSRESEDLLCMTAAHESLLGTYLKQVNGPALGVYQMEPRTLEDIWENYLDYRPMLESQLRMLAGGFDNGEREELVHNLLYATSMARVHYFRDPEPLPKRSDYSNPILYLTDLAKYAKRVYNTSEGAAEWQDYLDDYLQYWSMND